MSFYSELDPLTLEQLIRCFEGDPQYQFEKNSEYFGTFLEEIACAIKRHGDAGIRFLLSHLDTADDNHLASLLCALSSADSTLFDPESLYTRYLDHHEPMVQVHAIRGLKHHRIISTRTKVLHSLKHGEANVIGVALDYLGALFPKEARPYLLKALRAEHFIVRESAVDVIDDYNMTDLIPFVVPLLHDPHPDVRQAAKWAVDHAR